jgi:quercetin dioxygenase-like cupin family protein
LTRICFHIHSGDQILIVTEGKGIVATDAEEREVTVGDVILISAGEKHWHGATKDSAFSHITVQIATNKMTQPEE